MNQYSYYALFTIVSQRPNQLVLRLCCLVFFLFAFVGFSVRAQVSGAIITMKYNDANIPSANIDLKWFASDNALKLQMVYNHQNQTTNTIFLPVQGENNLLMFDVNAEPRSKILFTLPVAEMKGDTRFVFKRSQLKVTDEQKKIAGMDCRKMILSTERFTAEFWVAVSLPDASRWAGFFQSYPELSAIAESDIKGFPLASTIRDLSGKLIASFETTSVEQSRFSSSEFSVPAGYVKAEDFGKK